MGKLTSEVFPPSCCEGGTGPLNTSSAQVCGCDEGANWKCERHREVYPAYERDNVRHPELTHMTGEPMIYSEDKKVKKMSRLKRHLLEVINVTWNYAGKCKTKEDEMINAALGLAGEAGEVADLHKKMLFHTPKPYADYREKLKYELSDVYYYLLKLQDLHGLSTKEIIAANREKLESRHPELGKVTERFGKDTIR